VTINSLIKDALASLEKPVYYLNNTGSSDTYLVFYIYNESGALIADDSEVATGFLMQLDIFTKGNFIQLAKDARKALETVGFRRIFAGEEDYIAELARYRKVLRFRYTTKIGEEL
jgi:hypothetical protein